MSINCERAEIEEVISFLYPEEGITLDQVLEDARLCGFEKIEIDRESNRIIVLWYKKING